MSTATTQLIYTVYQTNNSMYAYATSADTEEMNVKSYI